MHYSVTGRDGQLFSFCIIPQGLSGLGFMLWSDCLNITGHRWAGLMGLRWCILTEARALPKVSPVCDPPDTFPWLPETAKKKTPIVKCYNREQPNLSWNKQWRWFSPFPHLLNSLRCWLTECVTLYCCGEKWTLVGDPCSYQQPSLNVGSSPEQQANTHLIHGG